MVKKIIWLVIAAAGICCCIVAANIKFYAIENQIIDKKTGQKITYTNKNQFEKLLQDNIDIFENAALKLRNTDNISALTEISIPFNEEYEDIRFYGNQAEIDSAMINQELRAALEMLVQKLQINTIYIEPANIGMLSGKKSEKDITIVFAQTNHLNNTYQGIAYVVCGNENFAESMELSHYNLLTQRKGTVAFLSKFDDIGGTKWFYRCSRDLDWKTYTFWYRLYDVLNGNLK